MDQRKPSKRKKAKSAPKKASVAPPSIKKDEELNPLSKAERINIEQVFAQALSKYKDELLNKTKQHNKDLSHLSNMVEEYLSCFALIGYSIEGDKVCVFNAHNAKDEAALVDHLRSTFIDIANNRP